MKKQIQVFVAVVCCLTLLTACTPKQKPNTIRPMECTDNEQMIMDLVSAGSGEHIYLYDLKIDGGDTFEIWGEIYEHGKLVEDHYGGMGMDISDDSNKTLQRLALIVDAEYTYQWACAVEGDGITARGQAWESPRQIELTSAKAWSNLLTEESLADEKEVVLFSCVYTNQDSVAIYGPEEFLENPQLMENYEAVLLIKCQRT